MSYEPTNWKNGDIITAQKLNKIETELASKFLIIGINKKENTATLTKTWQEIFDAIKDDKIALIIDSTNEVAVLEIIEQVFIYNSDFKVKIMGSTGSEGEFTANSADNYPAQAIHHSGDSGDSGTTGK